MQSKSVVAIVSVSAVFITLLLVIKIGCSKAPNSAVLEYSFSPEKTAADTDKAYESGSEKAVADTVAVYGQGKVAIQPDQATITFGYQNEDADPKVAQDKNKVQMQQIVNAVKAKGVLQTEIQTASYQVSQAYDSKRFSVSNMVQVKINDIDKTSEIMKAAYNAGANEFWDVQFDIVKRQQAYTDALHLAMERAREKAEMLAAEEGRKVVGVISIEEASVNNNYWYTSPYTNYTNSISAASQSTSTGGYTDGGISSGEMEISAVVNVTYRLN